jgi:outer membrane receptor protein involved in Fe transport
MTIREATPFAIAALVSLAASGAGTTPARAQDAAEGAGPVLEEVVVTTRRREENLQDVPAAVSAFSADQLRELAITNLEDINSLAPNIKVNPGRATRTIRCGDSSPASAFTSTTSMSPVRRAHCSTSTTCSASKSCAGHRARCTARTRSRARSST